MSTMKRIVCLANSRKLSGRCVAGKECSNGAPGSWIRPVSARDSEEVSEYERQYEDGGDPRVLDIVDVPLLGPRPKQYQQENWLLDPDSYWAKYGQMRRSNLSAWVDNAEPLWINEHHTNNGRNDKIPLSLAKDLNDSLRLIQVDKLTLSVFKPGEAFGNSKRRVQGRFQQGGDEYRLWVTDPGYERDHLAKPDGDYEIGKHHLTVSLGEPYMDACFKLIAAIIPCDEGDAA